MAIKPKKGKVNGTNYSDSITWKNKGDWKRALKVYGYDGDDYINFKKSSYKKNKIYGGNGNDTILGGKNIDYIYGGLDNDTIYGYNGNDKLYGEYGNDVIFAGKGDDYVDGGFGDDIIYGQSGKNTLIGGFGNDVIYCGTGTEKIYGNQGNDTIVISKGTKNVYFNLGDGHDTIYNYGGTANLRFGYGTQVFSASRYDENGNYNFAIGYGNMGDTIYIANASNLSKMYYYVGGTKYAVSSLLKKGVTINANDNGGTIVGSQFDDFIVSGKGNDVIDGKNGSDIYVFSSGDGHDVIEPSRNGLDNDVIKFLEEQNLTYHKPIDNYDLIIKYNNDQDSITMKNYFMSTFIFPKIILNGQTILNIEDELKENLIIIEGTDEAEHIYGLNATPPKGNDIIYGYGGDDIIDGGLGEDTVIGGTGNDTMTVYNKDTFVFNIGDGNDIIDLGEDIYNQRKSDVIIKFNDVDMSDLTYRKSGNSIIIQYSENDSIKLKNYMANAAYYNNAPSGNDYNYTIVDKNGAKNKLSEVCSLIYGYTCFVGTQEDDVIYGTEDSDKIYGFYGDDVIYGYGGDDFIEGELGKNIIDAGTGNNTINITNYSNDTIINGGGTDTLLLPYLYNHNDRWHERISGTDFLICCSDRDIQITLKDFLLDHSVEYIQIQGEQKSINEFIQDNEWYFSTGAMFGGVGDDIINGDNNNNKIYGRLGNDTLYGNSGNDILMGGSGNNYLYGGSGNDEYVNKDLTNLDVIFDKSGSNDSISFLSVNKNDLILYFDLKIDNFGDIVEDFSKNMYITRIEDFGNTSKGIKVIDQFINANNIESVKTADGYMLNTSIIEINQLREDVAGWLHTNGFESVQQILDSHDETNINNLVAQFQNADWQVA